MQHFPLLDLPYHIRHDIYKYYMDNLKICVDSSLSTKSMSLTPRARFGTPNQVPSFYQNDSRVPQLNKTCRQLHEEVTPLVYSHVLFYSRSLVTDWFTPIPTRHLRGVRKFILSDYLVQVTKDLDRLIFPHLPQLQLVAWECDREPPLADLLDETPHSVIWHKEGPEKLLEILDRQNEYKAMQRVLATQVQEILAPYSRFIQRALQRGVAVEVGHECLNSQWRNSDEPSSYHEHNGPVFVSCVFDFWMEFC